ncbi:hypothetical protein AC249_AIPGENE20497, partial, partial [Paramuricea clavata]
MKRTGTFVPSTPPFSVVRKSKIADKDDNKDDSLQEFLEFADLQQFQEGLYREGIIKLDHLQDVDECDLNEIGMSKVEVKRFFRKTKEYLTPKPQRGDPNKEKVLPNFYKACYSKCKNTREFVKLFHSEGRRGEYENNETENTDT